MNNIFNKNYFILTGAMGAGKSTILKELKSLDVMVIDEPAREILKKQRRLDGDGVPEKNSQLFTKLMLENSIAQYNEMKNQDCPIIFDRGVPDYIAYADFFAIPRKEFIKAAKMYRYNTLVFFTPGWQDIYANDSERKMTYEQANNFGEAVKKIYKDLGYDIVVIPEDTASNRAQFIMKSIQKEKSI